MSFLTINISELKEKWMKLYINLNMITSHNVRKREILEDFKMTLCEFNEEVMDFFDKMEG